MKKYPSIFFATLFLTLLPGLNFTRTSVLDLAAENQWNEVMEIVGQGIDVNQTDAQSRTLLMLCAKLHYPDILQELIRKGSDIAQKDKKGQTALTYAVKNGQFVQSYHLIKSGANWDNYEQNGADLISFALSWNDSDTALTLIALGAVPNQRDYSKISRLLIEASERPITVAAMNMLKYDINFNTQDENSQTALMHAAQKGHYELAQGLINAGAQVEERDINDRTALGYAIKNNLTKENHVNNDPLQVLFDENYQADYKAVTKLLRRAGAKANEEIIDDLISREEKKRNFWNYYMRSQLYYWEIILFYLGIILSIILLFRQFDRVVDAVVLLFSIIIGFITTIGLMGNHFSEVQFLLTTTMTGSILFAILRALIITALAISLIYLIWQLLETTTAHNECVIVDEDLCCPNCGKPITLANRNKEFCPFCKKRFEEGL